MAGNRAGATKFIVEYIDKIIPGSPNKSIWESTLEAMSDKEFDQFINELEDGRVELSIVDPNFGKHRVSVKRNLQLAEELGFSFFERLKQYRESSGRYFLTPNKYPVFLVPIRRQVQMLEKKVSIPENNNSVDDLTGQPTGASKGSKISFPEIHVLAAEGLDKSILEFIKLRGGDENSFRLMNRLLTSQGSVNMDTLDKLGTRNKSVLTLKNIFTSMHLGSTL